MKKTAAFMVFALSLIILSMFNCQKICLALNDGYGRVLKDDVILYSKTLNDEYTPLFYLVKSYYVYIIDTTTDSDYYLVQYQENANNYKNILGYVKKSDLTLWDSPTAPYYPDICATIVNSTSLYDNPFDLNEKFYIPKGNEYKVYGTLKDEEDNIFYYVIIQNDLDGYISASMLEVDTPPLHSDPMPTPTPAPTPEPTTALNSSPGQNNGLIPDSKDGLLQILLISAICIPALIIVYLMFKPAKKNNRSYKNYYDDDDDEN